MRVPYGLGVVVDLPLVSQADTKLFKTTPTIAAGDAKLHSDTLILTTLTSKTRTFTSGGTYVIQPGDTVTGATSSATALVIGVRLTSGTFAGGDAAGVIFVEQDSGTFQSENLNVGSNSNVMTIGGALSSAGVFNEISTGVVGIGIPSTMLTCRQATLIVRDAAGAEWCDTAQTFETEGFDALLTGTAVAIANGTITLPTSTLPTVGSLLITLLSGTAARGKSRIASYSGASNIWNVDPAWNTSGEALPSGTIIFRVDPAPPSPATTLPAVNIEQVHTHAVTGDGTATPFHT